MEEYNGRIYPDGYVENAILEMISQSIISNNKKSSMKTNIKLNENYNLVSQTINRDSVVVETKKKTNHVFVVDVSYSMHHELPLIRTQLKNKLSNLMNEGDTISIVWFSGGRDAGILKEEVEVKSLKTLTDLHTAIDRWLTPVGMTAFLKPLQLVKDLINRIQTNRPDSAFSMIFLTDGYNNDCPWGEVISTLKSLENDISSSTFVEYGYYADTQKLTQMAGVLGGEKISCDGFDDFEPLFDAKISQSSYGGKKTVVEIEDAYLHDFAFTVSNGAVLLYNINDGKILVGGDVNEVHFFTEKAVNEYYQEANEDATIALYAGIYVLSDKLLNDDAEKLFYALGDQYHYKMLANSFGKQKLNEFKSSIKECISDESKRFPDGGRVAIQPVADDAYCLMNLIEDLGKIDGCLFYPNHPDFDYNKIGRGKIASATVITDADKKRLAEAKDFAELTEITAELAKTKVEGEFVNSDPNRGYPLTDLVWNESRANLSILTRIEGNVTLPENEFDINQVSSFKYRTYTIIKDGIVNVDVLPVSPSIEILKLIIEGKIGATIKTTSKDVTTCLTSIEGIESIVIDLKSLPIINRGMVKGASAKELAKLQWGLKKIQGDKKVYDFYKNDLYPKTSQSFVDLVGKEAADWLKTIGITDYNGFAPKVINDKSSDCYTSVVLETKIKGLSSFPKVLDVEKKIASGKPFKISETIMADAIIKYNAQLDTDMYKSLNEEQQKGILKTYLETKSTLINKRRRKVLQEIAQIKFSLILSKKWFNEFKTFDENVLNAEFDGQPLTFTFVLGEKQVEI